MSAKHRLPVPRHRTAPRYSNPDNRGCTRRRLSLYRRFEGLCFYCGNPMTYPDEGPHKETVVTREHLIPRSWGGALRGANLVAACNRCNFMRGISPWWDFLVQAQGYQGLFDPPCPAVRCFSLPLH